MIRNQQRDALPSSCSAEELSRALQSLDLPSVPPNKRPAAVLDRVMEVAAGTVTDPAKRHEIAISRLLHNLKNR